MILHQNRFHIIRRFPAWMAALLVAVLVTAAFPADGNAQSSVRPPASAQNQPVEGNVPGNVLGNQSQTEMWRGVRQGISGTVSIPDKKAGQLVQSEGDNWRAWRNGPVSMIGALVLAISILAVLVFYLMRGKIRIDSGMSGNTITRFNGLERMGHWLLAGSFIVLALTGLNILYGRYFMPTVIGKEAFAAITTWGKFLHNYVAFAFIAGLIWVFLTWVVHNIPNRHDLVWLAKAGGLFSKNVHPPSRKFNAGQKLIFWLTILGGASVALSGWVLLFPFTTSMFGSTFAAVNAVIGTELPTALSAVQEQQLAQIWHAAMSLFLTAVIIGHIYIGSVGMEGAFDAMGSGEVDVNWAKEHHNLWVEEVMADSKGQAAAKPAE